MTLFLSFYEFCYQRKVHDHANKSVAGIGYGFGNGSGNQSENETGNRELGTGENAWHGCWQCGGSQKRNPESRTQNSELRSQNPGVANRHTDIQNRYIVSS
ncbi:uncharacterized protein LOC133838174 [Drosophila sulfurigaster albostrigata]|uniref:uncharacterized protein LOC133838174 n=1 Tax=Drosophila sulfurigaster albostrigata TaxID=89887 RepID=UPI002D21995A|nr:uncharacterized protein LOC133838174 [Drosophila sulfurigaster albostrigata]